MKKIVHIINGLDQGGTETALFRLLQALNTDYQFYVIVLNRPGYYSSKIETLGIPIHYLSITKNPISACFKLIRHLKHIEPNVVQTWLYHADFIGGICANWCGIGKIIWSLRCEGIGLKKRTQFIKQSCALLSKKIPHHIITNSQAAADHHIQAGYQAHKIRVVSNGFDSNQFYPKKRPSHPSYMVSSKREEHQGEQIIIGTLARFHPDKDYFTLIQAIDYICELHPDVYIVCCGLGCNYDNKKLTIMLDTLTYSERVILINGVDNTPEYLNTLDLFIQSSKTESFSNSLAEAMLSGLPCIATDVGETAKICGHHAVLIPKENPEQLARACINMLTKTPSERKKLGELARKHIEACYSIEQHTAQIKVIYES